MAESPSSHPLAADPEAAARSKPPKDLGPDIEVEEVDLDSADVRHRSGPLTESCAAEPAAGIPSMHRAGRPVRGQQEVATAYDPAPGPGPRPP